MSGPPDVPVPGPIRAWWRRRGFPATDGPPAATAPPTQVTLVGVFDDEVRAEQSAAALQVWARTNRRLGVGPVAVLAKKPSGATSYRPWRVIRPRRGALAGLLIGLVLLALPAAGALGFASWALGTVFFGLLGLIGVIPSAQAGSYVLTGVALGAALAALLAGALGALIGCVLGALVGVIDARVRGLGESDVGRILGALEPGRAVAAVRTVSQSSTLVEAELARLGGTVSRTTAGVALEAPQRAGPAGAPTTRDDPADGDQAPGGTTPDERASAATGRA